MLLSEGQLNDHVGARLMFDTMPRAKVLIADKGYDSDDFRQALEECGVTPCIPPRRNRKVLIAYDKALYKTRHKIENLFAKLKDWRRVAIRPFRQETTTRWDKRSKNLGKIRGG